MSKSGIQPAGWRAWALAGLLLAGGLALRLAFDPLLGERYPFGTIYLIVGIVGWFVGFAPAVAVAVLGFLCGNVLFVEPRGTLFDGGEKEAVELAFFLLICAGSLLLVRRIHQREGSLRTAELAHGTLVVLPGRKGVEVKPAGLPRHQRRIPADVH